jgi:hypothetical protein
MEQFAEYFIQNKRINWSKKNLMNFNIEIFFRVLVMWTPYFATVLDAWANRNHPNMLFLFFEDMKKVAHQFIEFYK